MKSYQSYKPSGLEWIKEIPSHWEVLPNIALFKERNEKGYEHLPMLAVTINKGVITQEELLSSTSKRDSSNEDKSNYKRVCVGDLAYNKMRMWQGAVGYSRYEGIVSPAYIVLQPRVELDPRYFHYLFRTELYTKVSYRNSYGIHEDQLSLRFKDFKRMCSLVPPLEEQKMIADYLDKKLNEIDKLIEVKNKKISLLENYKKSLITYVVFNGLNNNKEKQKIDWEWIDSLPANWKVMKAKYLFKHVKRICGENHYKYERLALTLQGVIKRSKDDNQGLQPEEFETYQILKKNELVFKLIDLENVKTSRVGYSNYEGIVSPAYIVLQNKNNNQNNKYYYYYYMSLYYRNIFNALGEGVRSSLSAKNLLEYPVIVPPLEEQEKIVEYLDFKVQEINQLIDKEKQKIEHIILYRKSLVSNVVTGKFDIRHLMSEGDEKIANRYVGTQG